MLLLAVQTTQNIFPWKLDYVIRPDYDESPVPTNTLVQLTDQAILYPGFPFQSTTCDISWMQVTADLITWTSSVTAVVRCDIDGPFPVSASTVFTASPIPQRATWDTNRYQIPYPDVPDPTGDGVEIYNFGVALL